MTADLARENQELRQRLEELTAWAQHNEQILHKFQALELQLIGTTSFRQLFETVLFQLRRALRLETVTLALIDPQYEIRRMLFQLGINPADFPDLTFLDDEAALGHFWAVAPLPELGPFLPERYGFLFHSGHLQLQSVAVLPLVRRKKPIGCLGLGSQAPERFGPHMATDFIERLAAVVAICLENVTYNEQLKYTGFTDPLTGIHNRRYFEQRLREELARSQRGGRPLSCLFLDLDHFKRINDSYGHLEGDRVLREAARRIKVQLRLNDALARYGGEEFAGLLGDTDAPLALTIAERIRQNIAAPPFPLMGQQGLAVTLSIGVATFHRLGPKETVDRAAEKLVAMADRALYRAKEAGRNQVVSEAALERL